MRFQLGICASMSDSDLGEPGSIRAIQCSVHCGAPPLRLKPAMCLRSTICRQAEVATMAKSRHIGISFNMLRKLHRPSPFVVCDLAPNNVVGCFGKTCAFLTAEGKCIQSFADVSK